MGQTVNSIRIYTLPCLKWFTGGKLLGTQGAQPHALFQPRWGWGGRGEALQGGDIHKLMADSCSCMAETITVYIAIILQLEK